MCFYRSSVSSIGRNLGSWYMETGETLAWTLEVPFGCATGAPGSKPFHSKVATLTTVVLSDLWYTLRPCMKAPLVCFRALGFTGFTLNPRNGGENPKAASATEALPSSARWTPCRPSTPKLNLPPAGAKLAVGGLILFCLGFPTYKGHIMGASIYLELVQLG